MQREVVIAVYKRCRFGNYRKHAQVMTQRFGEGINVLPFYRGGLDVASHP
jgi:hypothetical protein